MPAISSINERFVTERPSLDYKSTREENLSMDSSQTTIVASSAGNRAIPTSELHPNEIHETVVETQNGEAKMLITGPAKNHGMGNDALVVTELAEDVTLIGMFNGIPGVNESAGFTSRAAALEFIGFDPRTMDNKHPIEEHFNNLGQKMIVERSRRKKNGKGPDVAIQVAVVSPSGLDPEKFRTVDFYTCGAVYGQHGDSIIIGPDGNVYKGFDANQHTKDVYDTGLANESNNIARVGYNTVPIGSKIIISNRHSYVGKVHGDEIQYIKNKAKGNPDATDLGVIVLTIK